MDINKYAHHNICSGVAMEEVQRNALLLTFTHHLLCLSFVRLPLNTHSLNVFCEYTRTGYLSSKAFTDLNVSVLYFAYILMCE